MSKSNNPYIKLKGHVGIYKHPSTGMYQATKKVLGRKQTKSFKKISDAKKWRMSNTTKTTPSRRRTSKLHEVWQAMQENHFPLLRPSTQTIWLRRYELVSQLESYNMHTITKSVVEKWLRDNVKYFQSSKYQALKRGGASRKTLNNELNLLNTIFNWYRSSSEFEHESDGIISPVIPRKHKPMARVRYPEPKNRSISPLDALNFFEELKPVFKELAQVQYFTASRIGEIAGLQWKRVDFTNRTITIMETSVWDSSKIFVGLNPTPKNKTPKKVSMTDNLYDILKAMENLKEDNNDFVFHQNGKPLNYSTILTNFNRALKRAKLPYSGTHILRHGMAKLARQVGGGLDAVIAMTHHKDMKLADHYSKLDESFHKEVSEKIMSELNKIAKEANIRITSNQETDNVINIANFAKTN